mmetsp:Transcript_27739/g.50548  ORF Transcript_27739/g.50548 Transcript_27739/m.50548 type:complete len:173 (+) Transcript_27739:572-1090(+)
MRPKQREHKKFSLTNAMSRMRAMMKDMHERIDVQSCVSLVNRDMIIYSHFEAVCMDWHLVTTCNTINSTDSNKYASWFTILHFLYGQALRPLLYELNKTFRSIGDLPIFPNPLLHNLRQNLIPSSTNNIDRYRERFLFHRGIGPRGQFSIQLGNSIVHRAAMQIEVTYDLAP